MLENLANLESVYLKFKLLNLRKTPYIFSVDFSPAKNFFCLKLVFSIASDNFNLNQSV